MGEIKRKRGRPIEEGAKRNRVEIRLTNEEAEMLNFILDKKGGNKTSIIVDALRTQYNLTKFQG